ncbi:MAG TPA: V-type ATP synthase subunit A, partial [Thermoanaerobacterales bacterium]|nr:V-type ATP synthase subunit A [Thermoanaerobacterales bacterium]
KKVVGAFLALDRQLAYARHFPSINWLLSYSGYVDMLGEWYKQNVSPEMLELRANMLKLLQKENQLMDIVKLVGEDVLPDDQRIILEIAKIVKVGYLQQNAYHKQDTYMPLKRQYSMLKTIEKLYERANNCIKKGVPISKVKNEKMFSDIVMMKYNDFDQNPQLFKEMWDKIDKFYNELETMYEEGATHES